MVNDVAYLFTHGVPFEVSRWSAPSSDYLCDSLSCGAGVYPFTCKLRLQYQRFAVVDIHQPLIRCCGDDHETVALVWLDAGVGFSQRCEEQRRLVRCMDVVGLLRFGSAGSGIHSNQPFAGAKARPFGQSDLKNFPVITVSARALIGSGRFPFAQNGDHPHFTRSTLNHPGTGLISSTRVEGPTATGSSRGRQQRDP